jgi:hypothetical protein
MLAEQNANSIMDRLKTWHHFQVTAADERGIRALSRTFSREGVQFFGSSFRSPGYATLMTLTDGRGKNWSYLATKENYSRVRLMEQQNLIVPLVGDFAGPKAIRAVAQYLKDQLAQRFTSSTFPMSKTTFRPDHDMPGISHRFLRMPPACCFAGISAGSPRSTRLPTSCAAKLRGASPFSIAFSATRNTVPTLE